MIIRPAGAADVEAITAIYRHHVLNGLGTFEEIPPDAAEMALRKAGVDALRLPFLVAEEREVMGYAYVAPFRTRAAYRYTVEDSVYVSPDHVGRGVGKALLTRLVETCEAMGLRQMMAVIGDSGNAASIGLHEALGFRRTGVSPALGSKFGRWVDLVWMQRALGGGAEARPKGPGWISIPEIPAGA